MLWIDIRTRERYARGGGAGVEGWFLVFDEEHPFFWSVLRSIVLVIVAELARRLLSRPAGRHRNGGHHKRRG